MRTTQHSGSQPSLGRRMMGLMTGTKDWRLHGQPLLRRWRAQHHQHPSKHRHPSAGWDPGWLREIRTTQHSGSQPSLGRRMMGLMTGTKARRLHDQPLLRRWRAQHHQHPSKHRHPSAGWDPGWLREIRITPHSGSQPSLGRRVMGLMTGVKARRLHGQPMRRRWRAQHHQHPRKHRHPSAGWDPAGSGKYA
ncbi:hypothetical protein ACVW0Y_004178 [Pseudomonas sp. TE3786]